MPNVRKNYIFLEIHTKYYVGWNDIVRNQLWNSLGKEGREGGRKEKLTAGAGVVKNLKCCIWMMGIFPNMPLYYSS